MTDDGIVRLEKVTDQRQYVTPRLLEWDYGGVMNSVYAQHLAQLLRPSPIMELWRRDAERARAEFAAQPWIVRAWVTSRRNSRRWWTDTRYRVAHAIYAFDEGDGW